MARKRLDNQNKAVKDTEDAIVLMRSKGFVLPGPLDTKLTRQRLAAAETAEHAINLAKIIHAEDPQVDLVAEIVAADKARKPGLHPDVKVPGLK